MLQKSFKLIDADGSLGFVSAGQVSNVNCFSLIFNAQSQGPNVRSRNYAKVLFFMKAHNPSLVVGLQGDTCWWQNFQYKE